MPTVQEVRERFRNLQPLAQLAANMREVFQASDGNQRNPEALLLFAYNGTGKTRLSMEFVRQGLTVGNGDTLYFNAFTEDLFDWDNARRVLKIKQRSRFFSGIFGRKMEESIRSFLHEHVDFNFAIDGTSWEITFSRIEHGQEEENIKISRGEERLFIWCIFLSILQLAFDGDDSYSWVRYVYIDDPVSSLDDNNVVSLACNFSRMFKERSKRDIKLVISTHHSLFYNIMHNEFREKEYAAYFFFTHNGNYAFKYSNDSPFLHHLALLKDLQNAVETDELYTYHFAMLRIILEKTAQFHGFRKFSDCLGDAGTEAEAQKDARLINLMSHGHYSLFEPREMVPDNKENFRAAMRRFLAQYPFNIDAFSQN